MLANAVHAAYRYKSICLLPVRKQPALFAVPVDKEVLVPKGWHRSHGVAQLERQPTDSLKENEASQRVVSLAVFAHVQGPVVGAFQRNRLGPVSRLERHDVVATPFI